MIKKIIQLVLIIGCFIFMFGINGCTSENEESTGLFNAQITGDIQGTMEGEATFTFIPKTDYGWIIIRLEEDEFNYIVLSFVNPSDSRVYLEPGDYLLKPFDLRTLNMMVQRLLEFPQEAQVNAGIEHLQREKS